MHGRCVPPWLDMRQVAWQQCCQTLLDLTHRLGVSGRFAWSSWCCFYTYVYNRKLMSWHALCQCYFFWLLFNMVGPFNINLLYFSLTFRGILVSHDVIGWGVVTFFSFFDWWRINTSAPLSNLNTCLTLEGVQRASEQLHFVHCDVINVQ